jgi:hypothetical protein
MNKKHIERRVSDLESQSRINDFHVIQVDADDEDLEAIISAAEKAHPPDKLFIIVQSFV